eukprot:gene4404-7779_t
MEKINRDLKNLRLSEEKNAAIEAAVSKLLHKKQEIEKTQKMKERLREKYLKRCPVISISDKEIKMNQIFEIMSNATEFGFIEHGFQPKEGDLIFKIDNKLERGENVHLGIICDGCEEKGIKGKRYKCNECLDFDFCEKCLNDNSDQHFDGLHTFEEIDAPRDILSSLMNKM